MNSKLLAALAVTTSALVGCGRPTAASIDGSVDSAPATPDLGIVDTRAPDYGPRPDFGQLRVLYAVGDEGIYQIDGNGGGKRRHPDLPTGYLIPLSVDRIELAQLAQPRVSGARVRLPGGKGSLLHLCDLSKTICSLHLLRKDGSALELADGIRWPKWTSASVSLDDTGALLVLRASTVRLVRTDGAPWPKTKAPHCELFTKGDKVDLLSTVFGAKGIYLLVRDRSDDKHHAVRLYRAPLDCTEVARELGLPLIAGAAPLETTALRASADGSMLAFSVGTGQQWLVLAIDDNTGVVDQRGSVIPGPWPLMPFAQHYRVAPGPRGQRLAYIDNSKLLVQTLGSGQGAKAVGFPGLIILFAAHWLSDDLLLVDGMYQDKTLSRVYSLSSDQVLAADAGMVSTPPVFGFPWFSAKSTWISQNGRYLCYRTRETSAPTPSKLLCRDRQSGAVVDPGGPQLDDIDLALAGSKAIFVAQSPDADGCAGGLWIFDSDAPKRGAASAGPCGVAKRLFVADSGDAAIIERLAGLTFYDLSDAQKPTARLLETRGDRCNYGQVLIAPDGEHVVYTVGEGPNCRDRALRIQKVGVKTSPLTLDQRRGTTPLLVVNTEP